MIFRSRRRKRLSTTAREELYDRCRGGKDFPDCNICNLPITPGQLWHESHNPRLPHALGGEVDGISHARCNLAHARSHDVPLIAKVRRKRQKHIGAYVPETPMPGGREDRLKKTMSGRVVERATGLPPQQSR